ncbi:hypothetical protein [Canibacter zhoujuaniae]|uniref:hypothetical protein n=1 Tax=Canibacter zhoujuaniae TaxID=2708343 RepID=UPI001423CEF0|nr:hypothetical protein [Canibacter zhoujuaniae]
MSDLDNRLKPIIAINDIDLDVNDLDGDILPVRELSIKWGANDWFEDYEPAILKLNLLETNGIWQDWAGTEKANITVRVNPTPDSELYIFRGQVTQVEASPLKITRNNHQETVWEVQIEATDPLGAMARDRRRGYVYPLLGNGKPEGYHWAGGTNKDRRKALDERCPVPIMWQKMMLDENDDLRDTGVLAVGTCAGYEHTQTVSALTVLRNTARMIHLLARPAYDPVNHRVIFFRPSGSGRYSRNWKNYPAGEKTHVAGSDIRVLSGTACIGKPVLSLSPTNQVNRLEIEVRGEGAELVERRPGAPREKVWRSASENYVLTAFGADKNESQSTLQITTDYSLGWHFGEYLEQLQGQGALRVLLRNLQGRRVPQPFTVKLKTNADVEKIGADLAFRFLTPFIHLRTNGLTQQPYFINESLLNYRGVTDIFAICGGEIRFTNSSGWLVTPTPTATPQYLESANAYLRDLESSTAIKDIDNSETITDWERLG